jgi:protein-histidine pros-kinase
MRARFGGDNKLIVEIISMFLEESPEQLRRLKQASSESNAEAVERIAHSMKGEFGCLDISLAADYARKIEEIARSGRFDNVAEPLLALETEMQAVAAEMDRFLEQERSSHVGMLWRVQRGSK